MLTIVALDPADGVVGGVVGEWHEAPRTLLIAYLAVRRDERGHGLGTELMRAAADRWYPRFEPLLVLGELRDPRHHAERDEYALVRVHFYDRLGAKVLLAPYFQPRLRPDAQRVDHMLLAVFHASSEALRGADAVDASVLTSFLDEYVRDSEGEAAFADPAVLWLRSFYARESRIPMLALSRYREVPDPDPPGSRDSRSDVTRSAAGSPPPTH
jgi:GNAT superfamily N-acetyltransferase